MEVSGSAEGLPIRSLNVLYTILILVDREMIWRSSGGDVGASARVRDEGLTLTLGRPLRLPPSAGFEPRLIISVLLGVLFVRLFA